MGMVKHPRGSGEDKRLTGTTTRSFFLVDGMGGGVGSQVEML